MKEIFKDIRGHEGLYQISNLGRVKSFYIDKINGKILEPIENNDGYLFVNLYKNNKPEKKQIHNLLFETFNNYILKEDECIHHIDFVKKNNFLENLQVMTKGEHNKIHKTGEKNYWFGSKRAGEKSGSHKLKNQDVLDIRKTLELKLYTQKQLSWMYDISITTISNIKNNRIWKNLIKHVRR